MSDDYYVYTLSRPDGGVFYVGMGHGERINRHEVMANRGDRSERSNIIRKVIASGQSISKNIVRRFHNDIEAKQYEVSLIAEIGRKDLKAGPLVNRTNGGDGVTGWSEEMRAQHSEATKHGMRDEQVRARCREQVLRQREDPKVAEQMTARLTDYWKDPVNRAAQAERVRMFAVANPERFQEGVERRRAAVQSPECRQKMRLAKLGKKQDSIHVAKRAEAIRRAGKPADFAARVSAGKRAAKLRRQAAEQV